MRFHNTKATENIREDVRQRVVRRVGIEAIIVLAHQQIVTAAEQQSAVAEEINRSVLNVRDISEQTAGVSDETAASSVELARLGNELQVMVSRFRT